MPITHRSRIADRRRRCRGLAVAGALAACSAPAPAPTRRRRLAAGSSASDRRRRAREGRQRSRYWSWTPSRRGAGRGLREGVPEGQGQPRQRRHQQRRSTPSCRTPSRPAPARPTSRRSSTTPCRSSRSPTRSSTSRSTASATLEDDYTPRRWGSVNVGGELVGLPQDSGPMALFYNKTVFDKYGIDRADHVGRVRRRREEAARRRPDEVHHQRHRRRRLHDQHDLAGGRPPFVDRRHEDVTIDLADAGHARSGPSIWNQLVEDGPASRRPPGWSDEWYKGLGDGTSPRLVTGAWMPGVTRVRRRRTARALARRADADLRRHRGDRRERRRRPGRASKQSKNPALAAGVPAVAEQRPGVASSLPRDAAASRRRPPSLELGDVRRPEARLLRRPEDQRGARAGVEGRADRLAATCPSRSTPTASSATPSARPTRTRAT